MYLSFDPQKCPFLLLFCSSHKWNLSKLRNKSKSLFNKFPLWPSQTAWTIQFWFQFFLAQTDWLGWVKRNEHHQHQQDQTHERLSQKISMEVAGKVVSSNPFQMWNPGAAADITSLLWADVGGDARADGGLCSSIMSFSQVSPLWLGRTWVSMYTYRKQSRAIC